MTTRTDIRPTAAALWQKSTHSAGHSNCVEVAPDRQGMAVRDSKLTDGSRLYVPAPTWTALTTDLLQAWRKSSHSGAHSNCVEVAPRRNAAAVRDSKRPAAPHLCVPAAAWTALATRLRQGT